MKAPLDIWRAQMRRALDRDPVVFTRGNSSKYVGEAIAAARDEVSRREMVCNLEWLDLIDEDHAPAAAIAGRVHELRARLAPYGPSPLLACLDEIIGSSGVSSPEQPSSTAGGESDG